jgi:phosphatidyl-myo-inositol dimannoside synthase
VIKTRLNKRMPYQKILVPSFDFKPSLGGVAHYTHELLTTLKNEHNFQIHVLARDLPESRTYDQSSGFSISRIKTSPIAALALPFWAWEIKKLIEKFKPDFIFCPLWFPDASATHLALKMSAHQAPYFVAAHAMELIESDKTIKLKLRKFLLAQLKKNTFDKSQKIFPVSHFTKKILQENLNISEKKIKVATNGINLQVYKNQTPTTQRFSQKKKTLLTVSRLLPYKGVDFVLKALPSLIKQGFEIEYKVVGIGKDLPRLQSLARELGVDHCVSFLGALTQQEIIQLYCQADLFILLSRIEWPDVEGFGLVFLEAAACGLPSLGGDSGGIPDAIENGRSGWLVPPTNLDLIQEKLRDILSDSQKLQTASEYGLNMVLNRTWKNTAKNILEGIYEA